MNVFQMMLGHRLMGSTVTPGVYRPTPEIKAISAHAVVFAVAPDGTESVAVICGPASDPASMVQADAIAASADACRMFGGRQLLAGAVAGDRVPWAAEMGAFASKPAGQVEQGGEDGPVLAILVDFDGHAHERLVWMCACTETARALDPAAPPIGDLDGLILAGQMVGPNVGEGAADGCE